MSIYTYPVIDFQLPSWTSETWKPVLKFGSLDLGISYTTASGLYWTVNNLIVFQCSIKLTNKGTAVGDATIEGLPFLSTGFSGDGRLVYYNNMVNMSSPGGYVDVGSSTINLTNSSSSASINLNDSNFTDTSELKLNGYFPFSSI